MKELIKVTKDYKITKRGDVYSIHFFDKFERDKCRVTRNYAYIEKYL